ncbi:hypothetical protein Pcinc_044476, partial [Petrolisthes cinctipes]
STWISWPLAFLLQGVFDDLVDDPALPVRFRNWNTTLRLKGTSPSRIVDKIVERRSPQPSPSTSPLPPEPHHPSLCPQRSPIFCALPKSPVSGPKSLKRCTKIVTYCPHCSVDVPLNSTSPNKTSPSKTFNTSPKKNSNSSPATNGHCGSNGERKGK